MSVFKVNIKWQANKFADVECDISKSPLEFKAILYSLTCVPPERQKVMIQGVILGDDSWHNVKIKNGAMIMMIGSAEKLPEPPKVTPQFVEDMDDVQLGKALDIPAGLNNLGNTCYMNATLQCLKTIPELNTAMRNFLGKKLNNSKDPQSSMFMQQIATLYHSMDDQKGSSISPFFVFTTLQSLCPQFAERGEQGGFAQQDANECWVEIIRRLEHSLEVPNNVLLPSESSNNVHEPMDVSGTVSNGENTKAFNFVQQFLTGRFRYELQPIEETDAEKVSTPEVAVSSNNRDIISAEEDFSQLSCYIIKELKYLESGIRHGLESTLSRYSESLQRNAEYKKISKISRLPSYLCIQMMRFSYKEKKELSVKILKEVKYPLSLDMYEFCTPDLQKNLEPMRAKIRVMDEKIAEEAKLVKIARTKGEKIDTKKKEPNYVCHWLQDDIGASNSGLYELQAVLTHQGRSSRSGHYLAWIKKDEETWFKCDDDDVTVVTTDAILKLAGGGDWHTAYVLLYGPKLLDLNLLNQEELANSSTIATAMNISVEK